MTVKLSSLFTRIATILFALFFGLVLFCAGPALLQQGGWWLLAAVPVALGYLLLWQGLQRLAGKTIRLLACIALPLFFALLCGAGYLLRVAPSWDLGRVYEAALDLCANKQFTVPTTLEYLYMAPHNLFLTYVFWGWFRFASLFGVPPLNAGILLNALALTAAMLFLYLAVSTWKNPQAGLFTIIVCAGFSPLYLYAPIFYTDTLSMPFVTLTLWLALLWHKSHRQGHRVLFASLCAAAAFGGYLVKQSAIIPFIAVMLFCILQFSRKNILPGICALALTLCLFGGWQLFLSNNPLISYKAGESLRLTASHYIMMGLQGNGGYSGSDHAFSTSIPDLAQRQQTNWQVAWQRLQAYGVAGFLQHMRDKIIFTWADGSYYAPHKLSIAIIAPGPLHTWVLPGALMYPVYIGLASAMHALLLVAAFAGALRDCMRKHVAPNLLFIARTAVLGLGLFLLAWETRSRYLLNHLPLLALLLAAALMQCSDWAYHLIRTKKARSSRHT